MTYDGQSPTDKKKYLELDLSYIKERWDNRAERWDIDLLDQNSHFNRLNSYKRFLDILDSIFNSLNNFHYEYFLDLACGTGVLLEKYSSLFRNSVGVDLSDKMLAKAGEKKLINTTLVQKDCFHFFTDEQKYNFIASRGVLISHYGIDNSLRLLSSIYNALDKDGIIFLDALNVENKDNPKEKTLYSTNQLYELFRQSGFSKIKIYEEDKYPLLYVEAQK